MLLGTRLKPLAKPTSTWKGADKRPCLGWERQLCETEEEWMTCWKEQFKFKHPRLAWETQLRKTEREEQMLGWKEERIDHLYSWHPNDWLIFTVSAVHFPSNTHESIDLELDDRGCGFCKSRPGALQQFGQ